MLYLIAIVIGLVIGFARGGRLSHLARLRLRWLWLVPVALVIQLLIFPLISGAPLLPYATAPLHILSYAILVVWLVMNARGLPIGALLAGAACNFAAIASNGGYMPASPTALRHAGLEYAADRLLQGEILANVIPMSPSTRCNLLGDWLYLPSWIPFATAFSIGDMLIMVGLAWLIAKGMRTDDGRLEKAA